MPSRLKDDSGRFGKASRNGVSSLNDRAEHPKDPVRDHREEAALFLRHLRGDHGALMELFDRYNEPLWIYCARILGDEEQASDIVQALWEKIILLRTKETVPPEKPASYLFSAARNLCLNHFRSRKGLASIDDLAESEHPRQEMPEQSHLEELVAIALTRLPETQREVLALNAYSGYGFDEIADLLGKPVGAVHTIAWRARKRLGQILAKLMKGEATGKNRKKKGGSPPHDPLNNHHTEHE